MENLKLRPLTLLAALAVLGGACTAAQGPTGTTGPTGATGAQGSQGTSAVPTGTIKGILTYAPTSSNSYPATGVSVTVSPDVGLSPVLSGSDGSFNLTVPVGVYTVSFAGPGFVAAELKGVTVVAGQVAPASMVLTATLPFAAVPAANIPNPAGFGQTVTVGVTILKNGQVVSDTSGYTFAWSVASAPVATSSVAISNPGAQSFTFTTDTFATISQSTSLVGFTVPARASLVGVTYAQMVAMTYDFSCTVTDPQGFTTQVAVGVMPAMTTAGNTALAPQGVMLIAASDPGDTGPWTLVPPSPNAAGAPTLDNPANANPTFIPSQLGVYTLARGTSGKTNLTINVGRYEGSAANCGTACHGTLPATQQNDIATKFAEYAGSAHGSTDVVSEGLDGAFGPGFSAYCLTCHTVGYNTAPSTASNGGFVDVASQVGWTFPTKLQPGNSAAMPPELVKLNKVQCESCHGPLGAHETLVLSTPGVMPVAEWSAQTCAVCHDDPPNADKFQLWSQSAHADMSLTSDATVDNRGTTAGHCGRCHSAQGFAAYVLQQQGVLPNPSGGYWPANSGVLLDPSTGAAAGTTYLQSLGLTNAQVQSQTCQSCHDPHTTQLRVDGNTGPLASGFSFSGAGAGAVCMICHNTRNGSHGDAYQTGGPGAPHTPSQTDVYAGQNAYFTTGNVSMHGAVADTCAGCHVYLHPTSITVASTNHTFKADTTICANCHSSDVDGAGTEGTFNSDLNAVYAQMLVNLNAATGGASFQVLPQNTVTENPASAPITISQVPTALSLTTIHGQPALTFTLGTAITDPFNASGTTTSVTSLLGDVKNAGGTYSYIGTSQTASSDGPTKLVFAKAVWNALLVSDGSNAIHNPTFVFNVLGATQSKLAGEKPTGACSASCL